VVPRKEDMPPEQHGKRVFDWLDMPKEEAITDGEADRIALDLRPLLAREMFNLSTTFTTEAWPLLLPILIHRSA
jgi:hypothetical protein